MNSKYDNRMVALSDGVFALAIAILLITSSVPNNFEELKTFLSDIPAFGVCITFIYWIWNEQNTVFQYYDIFDGKMNFLHLILLFGVLVYVYPLKFLMKWLLDFLSALIGGTLREEYEGLISMIAMENIPVLMIIYGLGFVFIFFCLYLMHRYGMTKDQFHQLDRRTAIEYLHAKDQVFSSVLIGLVSIGLALIGLIFRSPIASIMAGVIYNFHWATSLWNKRKMKKALESI